MQASAMVSRTMAGGAGRMSVGATRFLGGDPARPALWPGNVRPGRESSVFLGAGAQTERTGRLQPRVLGRGT